MAALPQLPLWQRWILIGFRQNEEGGKMNSPDDFIRGHQSREIAAERGNTSSVNS